MADKRLTQSPRAIRKGNADPYHDSSNVQLEQDEPKATSWEDYSSENAVYKDGSGRYF